MIKELLSIKGIKVFLFPLEKWCESDVNTLQVLKIFNDLNEILTIYNSWYRHFLTINILVL